MVWPDGARYQGNWDLGFATGKGKFFHVNNETYDGDWKMNMAHG